MNNILQLWKLCFISNLKFSFDACVKPKQFIAEMTSTWPVLQVSLVCEVITEPCDTPAQLLLFLVREKPH